MGLFTKQALKSNQGDEDWLRFFALMGSAIAAIEQCNPVPATPSDKLALIDEIECLCNQLHVSAMLAIFLLALSEAIPVVGTVVPGSTLIVGISALSTGADVSPWLLVIAATAGAIWQRNRFARRSNP